MQRTVVYCADIGSVRAGRFAWASSRDRSFGATMPSLVASVSRDLATGLPVALGFECPLFVPLASEPEKLSTARCGEGNRSWSAGAGCGALATGLVQTAWLLREIRKAAPKAKAFLDWEDFQRAKGGLFLWEAFVSGAGKRESHQADARAAVNAFEKQSSNGLKTCIWCDEDVFSLIGAALLRSGWSTDLKWLSEPCVVVSASSLRRAGVGRKRSVGAAVPT